MIVNLAWVSHVIDSLTMQGKLPAELHMSEQTHKLFTAAMIASGAPEPQPEKVGRKKVIVWRFRNLPLVVNEKVPDNGLLVRPLHLLADPNWLDKCMEEQRQIAELQKQTMQTPPWAMPPQPPRTEIRHELPAAPAKPNDPEVRSSEAFGKSIESVTDVLISATTRCDDVEKVIVISVRRGEVEVMSNGSRYEVFGLLQAALSKVAQEG